MKKLLLIKSGIRLFFLGIKLHFLKTVLNNHIKNSHCLSFHRIVKLSKKYEKYLLQWSIEEKQFISIMFSLKKA